MSTEKKTATCRAIGSKRGEPCGNPAIVGDRCWQHREDFQGLCGARKRDGSGDRCRRPAGAGTDHLGYGSCRLHAGTTPNGRMAAERMKAEAHLSRLGAPIRVAPDTALKRMIWASAGRLHRLWEEIEEAEPGSAEERTLIAAEAIERDRLARISKMAIDAGIAEREVAAQELLASVATAVAGEIVDQLGLSAAQRERVPQIVGDAMLKINQDSGRELVPGGEVV